MIFSSTRNILFDARMRIKSTISILLCYHTTVCIPWLWLVIIQSYLNANAVGSNRMRNNSNNSNKRIIIL